MDGGNIQPRGGHGRRYMAGESSLPSGGLARRWHEWSEHPVLGRTWLGKTQHELHGYRM